MFITERFLLLRTVLRLLELSALSAKMFPFLLLPREIRDKIYGYLFEGPNGKTYLFLHGALAEVGALVTKATSGEAWTTLPNAWKPMDGWSLSGGLSLFRTCKLVRSEAAASLYGQNWFFFNGEGSEPYRHPKGMTPRCGISYMYDFLRIIGSENRKSIRRFAIYIHHHAHLIHKNDPVEGYSSLAPAQVELTLGEHLVNVFDILSQGHSLDAIGFYFMGKSEVQNTELLQIFLRDVSQSVLMQTMMKLNGSINLDLRLNFSPTHWLNTHRAAYWSLIDRLASSPESEDTPSEGKAAESQAQRTSPSQSQLSKRHTELRKRIEERKNTFAQWEKLQLWIQQEEEQGRRDEAESRRIEESLNGLEQVFEDLHLHPGLP